MKRQDIDKRFTEAVNNLLEQGYVFHTVTMGGAQGEIAKVDLTNGEGVLRIMMEKADTYWGNTNIVLRVLLWNKTPYSDDTIWENRCVELYKTTFCQIKGNWYMEKIVKKS